MSKKEWDEMNIDESCFLLLMEKEQLEKMEDERKKKSFERGVQADLRQNFVRFEDG